MKNKNMAPLDVLASNEAPPENTHEISPSQENNNTDFENDNPPIEGSEDSETKEYSHDSDSPENCTSEPDAILSLSPGGRAWLAAQEQKGPGPDYGAYDRAVARAIEGLEWPWNTIQHKRANPLNDAVFIGNSTFYHFEGVPSDFIGRAWRLKAPETCWVKDCENPVHVLVYLLKNYHSGETVIGVDEQCPFLCQGHYLEDRDKFRDYKPYTNITGWAIDVKYRNLLPLRELTNPPKRKLKYRQCPECFEVFKSEQLAMADPYGGGASRGDFDRICPECEFVGETSEFQIVSDPTTEASEPSKTPISRAQSPKLAESHMVAKPPPDGARPCPKRSDRKMIVNSESQLIGIS